MNDIYILCYKEKDGSIEIVYNYDEPYTSRDFKQILKWRKEHLEESPEQEYCICKLVEVDDYE